MFRYGFKKRLMELGVDYGASVLAAVSGGVDSMCMVDALLHSQLDLQVAVAHVNFNLRGEESDADTRMVEQWCAEHNIPLFQESFNTTEFAQQEGISIEMAARDLRYNWFYTLMQEHGFNFLSIAHNANDNAETLLLNLTRGCGIEGIAGIREKVLLQFQQEQEDVKPYPFIFCIIFKPSKFKSSSLSFCPNIYLAPFVCLISETAKSFML